MNHDEAESRFAELDEQIRNALQVETPVEQISRLELFWQQQLRADRRRRRMRRAAVLAAALLVALSALFHLGRGPSPIAPQQDLLTHAKPVTPESNGKASPHRTATVPDAEDQRSIYGGRPATAYEQLLFAALVHQRESKQQVSAVDIVENAIACLIRDPGTAARQLLDSSELKSVRVERLLLRQLHRSDDQRKRAILKLLAVCGTSQSTAPLLKLSRRAVFREQALEMIEQTVGINELSNAVTKTDDASVRAAIYRRLFGNENALDAYLSLVQNDLLRDEVLVAADEVAQPMLDALLTRLNAEDRDMRLAAALVLGHANGPIVTESLIALVSENPASPDEAWIALMACRGPQADEFLAFATHQPRLLGPFNRARVYWARIMN